MPVTTRMKLHVWVPESIQTFICHSYWLVVPMHSDSTKGLWKKKSTFIFANTYVTPKGLNCLASMVWYGITVWSGQGTTRRSHPSRFQHSELPWKQESPRFEVEKRYLHSLKVIYSTCQENNFCSNHAFFQVFFLSFREGKCDLFCLGGFSIHQKWRVVFLLLSKKHNRRKFK